mgnify:CR=1 FL=1
MWDNLAIFYIDAGHGGEKPGATRTYQGKTYYEKDFNLQIALEVEKFLLTVSPTPTVYMYRTTDKNGNLSVRGQDAKNKGADVFISIHNNSTGSSAICGTLTLYPKTFTAGWETSKDFANTMQKTLINYLNTRGWNMDDKGLTTWTNSSGELGVFVGAAPVPACLVECAFMSCDGDIQKLLNPEFIADVGYAVALGAVTWQNQKRFNLSEPVRYPKKEETIPGRGVLFPLLFLSSVAGFLYYLNKNGKGFNKWLRGVF